MYRPAKIFLIIAILLLTAVWTSCSDDPADPEEKPTRPPACRRVPLPPPTNTILNVASVGELYSAVGQANSTGNTTIMLEDGTYTLYTFLQITGDDITIRSRSGIRDSVVIRGSGFGGGGITTVFVDADGFVLADVTLGWTENSAVALLNDADNALFHNVRFVDADHMLVIEYQVTDSEFTDNGVVEWCVFEYTAGSGPDENCWGIVGRRCRNWNVRHNVLKNFRSPNGTPAIPAVMFLAQSSGTVAENNIITNCDRGIGFGLTTSGHSGGLIKNNTVHTVLDLSIGLESADSAAVYNNSIYTENYHNSIEYHFPETFDAYIMNNLTNAAITSRDGATGVVQANVVNAELSWFVDIKNGNGHLALAESTVVDHGQTLPPVTQDIDCETRPKGAGYDIGADER